MTTLYKPVEIVSAEQAEALSDGSIVINDTGDRYNRVPLTGWHSAIDDRDLTEDLDSTFMPPTITALVPIEAEEESVVDTAHLDLDPEREYWFDDPDVLDAIRDAPKRTRLVTPWEKS